MAWEYRRIGDVCTVERGGSPRPIDQYITDEQDGINWIKIGDTTDSMFITSTAQKIKPEGAKKSRYVQPGDFLLTNSMSFGRPYILKIDGCIHDGWLVLRDNDGRFDKRFLYYYLSSPYVYHTFQNMAEGGVVNNLNSEMVRKLMIPVLSITEQSQIADCFDMVDNLISLRKKQLQKLDDLIKSRFVEMFGDINEYCDVGYYIKALVAGKSLASEEECENKVLKTGAASFDFFDATQVKNLPLDYVPQQEHLVSVGDVIISRMNTTELTGAAAAYVWDVPKNIYLPDRLWKAILYNNSNPIFVWQMLIQPSTKEQIMRECSGTSGSMKNISKAGLLAIKVKKVPIIMQNQFADFVKQVYKSEIIIQQGLNKLEQMKQALMQKYFERGGVK